MIDLHPIAACKKQQQLKGSCCEANEEGHSIAINYGEIALPLLSVSQRIKIPQRIPPIQIKQQSLFSGFFTSLILHKRQRKYSILPADLFKSRPAMDSLLIHQKSSRCEKAVYELLCGIERKTAHAENAAACWAFDSSTTV
eukprot:TRINITY_DN7463_c0_g1_i2.p1 TRINITY_DN7463_c0_g1~~TRINITY_DN7463_c0_g1_i2.p1  ORF type:complete len:141 (-),score=1.95 TRINITY_DN7463_c0_g1_i2:35-457(-)